MTDPTPKTRWYPLTLDLFLIGLLVVECLLWLSERFQWFGFNHHKGWAVLVAVAVVGATIPFILLWFFASLIFHWRSQFTPVRAVIGLLAVEGLLWLSERFQWFGFNEQKGWTVLITVVGVAVALLLMLLWFIVALIFRWRFQFGIRSLLVLTVGVALPFSWLAVETKQAREQKAAVEAIRKLKGVVEYDWEIQAWQNSIKNPQPPGPAWLRSLLGDDFFTGVESVNLYYACHDATDADLVHLKGLSQLHKLSLLMAPFSDAGLENLKGLTQLQELELGTTRVTDAGLDNLKGMKQLHKLGLSWLPVTDAGLEKLKGLKKLQVLELACTQVTDKGLRHLEALPELRELGLETTHVTDAGLEHLESLSQLQVLNLSDYAITDAGIEHLRGLKQLRKLDLRFAQVTDVGLERLNGLKKLHELILCDTKVTDAGVKSLQKALPNCSIDSHNYY